ncbi:MAG: nucleotidyltransferase family protein [Parachlamydia sp.]|nr:nucleotidyltransferase family protein [Parachlamydia sp.]
MNMTFDKAKTLIKSHRKHLSRLGTRHLAIFGSTARNEARQTSDIDILVDFDAKKGLFVFADLKFYLDDILNCDVDLVSMRALHPALKKRILSEAKQVF